MLTPLAATLLLTAHAFPDVLAEVSLDRFRALADAKVVVAARLSPDGRTVSLWTRWRQADAPCLGWTIDTVGEKAEGLGEVPCPEAQPRGKRHLFVDSKVLGAPKDLKPVLDARRGLVALVLPHALGVADDRDGALVGAWHLGASTLEGVAFAEQDWLLWTKDAGGVDHLFLVDPEALRASPPEGPLTQTVPQLPLGSDVGWKKSELSRGEGPCTLEGRGVMIDATTLLFDWRASTPQLELRSQPYGEAEQRTWQLDVRGATPPPGLQVERVVLASRGLVRLKVRFPEPPRAVSISERGKAGGELSQLAPPLGGATCRVRADGVLAPDRFVLDARWR